MLKMKNEDEVFLAKDRLEVDIFDDYQEYAVARLYTNDILVKQIRLSEDSNDIALIKHFAFSPHPIKTIDLANIVSGSQSKLESEDKISQIYTTVHHFNSKFTAWKPRIISHEHGCYHPTLPIIVRSGIKPKEVKVIYEGQELIP